jgi:phosphoglucosamine mutase
MMGKYFGTDGFRGEAGVGLTAEHAFKIGRYLGYYLRREVVLNEVRRVRVLIGKDTRLSSYMLEYAIASGLASSGADVYLLHVTTTPSVSYVTVREGFDLGIMITASHNPFSDNGIKIIDCKGKKLGDDITDIIEEYLDTQVPHLPFSNGADVGRIYDYYAGRNGYIGRLISLAAGSYKGLRIGIDAANGAAFAIARSVFAALGAEIHTIADEPNGININYMCGSTHPEALSKLVKERGLDVGFAFDGDADRCIAMNEHGETVDGDGIMYILARRMVRKGRLPQKKIVATVMSNAGLSASLKDEGIDVDITKVGDRFVYERMQETGATLGGEQSGHIIISDLSATGDGILTALMITEEIIDTGMLLGELCRGLTLYPQRNESVRVRDKSAAANDEVLRNFIDETIHKNAGKIRLLVRESGTEPKIRVMVEAESVDICDRIISEIMTLLKMRGHTDD